MERLLIYLAVAAAVFAVLLHARLRPQPDYCGEVRRLAAAVRAVNRSGGWITDTFFLDRVNVTSSGIFHRGCGVEEYSRIANGTQTLELKGRVRLTIIYINTSPPCNPPPCIVLREAETRKK